MSKDMDMLIKEINALAKKSKEEGLTEEEKKKQNTLRQKYLEIFRGNFRNQLASIKVVDPNGNDVTPHRKHKIH